MPSERLLAGTRSAELLALGLQYGRFALVGLGATLVHLLAYFAAVELWGQPPLAANAIGFVLGVNVSFLGHRSWTFRGADADGAGRSLIRFWAVALIGLTLNTLFVHLITDPMALAYYWATPMIAGVTPVVTFMLSKQWAFRSRTRP